MKELQSSVVVDQFLSSLSYPVSREDILDRAEEAKLSEDVITALAALPSRDYADAADVTQELNPAS
ncbi:MAG TPA: DUF2795 domain-containing protein [Candidatus Dormibacteraeota bacterium]|jgi:hypothetical protein|nr:DUF2795 domain-containing protein [Candidatus Dormibacteraeota bacterium]